jgi:uncharacterized membrane protein
MSAGDPILGAEPAVTSVSSPRPAQRRATESRIMSDALAETLDGDLSETERRLLERLRAIRREERETADLMMPPERQSLSQEVADVVARVMGSWGFIMIQTTVLVLWMVLNLTAYARRWDPYPFILLNLALSFQAAYAAPFIIMSTNRQAALDRARAEEDYRTNIKAELEIELLHRKLDTIQDRLAIPRRDDED